MQQRLWQRSILLYCLAAALFLGVIDGKVIRQQRATYLAGMVAKSAEGREKDRIGVLFYSAMAQLFPRQAGPYVNLALCYYRLGQKQKAVSLYHKAIKMGADPNKIIIK